MSENKRLFLIDGMSVIYRAFHAIRNLTTRSGLPTNAVYGFTTTLRKIITQDKPDYLGVAMEGEGPAVRQATFVQYKAHRKPMPDELIVQLPYIERVCAALRIPQLSYPGYEADDVIGTVARKAVDAGLDCVIVTIDKDLYQLVSDHILVLDPRKDVLMDAKAVEEKIGVPPSRIVEWLALAGDSSDNIPGAPGIGDKGARELIARFGTVEACLARYSEVQRKTYRESLRDNAALIRQCYELATIPTNLPIHLDLEALQLSEPDMELAKPLFTELEFNSLLKDIEPASHVGPRGNYHAAGTTGEWEHLVSQLHAQPDVALALRSKPYLVVGLSAQAESGAFIEIPEAAGKGTLAMAALRELQQDPAVTKIYADLKEAHYTLRPFAASLGSPYEDVSLMAYLLDPNATNYRLSRLAFEYLNYTLPDSPPEKVEPAQLAEQADITGRLGAALRPKLKLAGLESLYRDMELPLIEVLIEMEETGVRMDTTMLAQLSRSLEQDLDRLTQKIYQTAGLEFNLNSPKQLGEVLFEKLQLPFARRTQKTKNYSTDSDTLEQLAESYELPRMILEYRQWAKLKSTYVDALPKLVRAETGRIHTCYRQTATATGRLSSSDPNFQNLPVRTELGRKIRAAVVPDPGCRLLSADYSQIELRILGHFSQDPVLVQAFRRSEDIHDRTAREVFGMQAQFDPAECRRRAKTINFGIIYGQTAFGLARELKIPRNEAQRFIDAYFERYKGVKAWLDSTLQSARETGVVKTLFGRIRQVPGIQSRDANTHGFAERMAVNSPIQGTAADLIKLAMIEVRRALRARQLTARLILQVHDELVFEVPERELDAVAAVVREKMEHVHTLLVPLVVDLRTGNNWRDLTRI